MRPPFDVIRQELIGKSISSIDYLRPVALRRLNSILASDLSESLSIGSGTPIRATGHWIFHTEADLLEGGAVGTSLSGDGGKAGIDPTLLTGYRRMWAGGEVRFHASPKVGDCVRKQQSIVDVKMKQSAKFGGVLLLTRQNILERIPHEAAPGGGTPHMREVDLQHATDLLIEEDLEHVTTPAKCIHSCHAPF
eukprot:gnl/MRDRNA2_/MRDRNA2_57433_c0_seq2.p1 gnl/MRDRNA2_/MRDRNA2_57433_c0~~gnl/MRDRNA2_/MRDRNA2_57433_c0_seq2.p1  ORF type:complete len:193 (+),score=35.64 gnl/MRDRNA2_/MRDRNA2_57433_c0_seq2:119-697(+)